MKSKHKTSEQIYHSIIPLQFTELLKKIIENDHYLDNIESKVISFDAVSAELELAFKREGRKTAVQRVKLSQHDHLASHVTVYPVFSESQRRSWFFPFAFMLILFMVINVALRSTPLTFGLSLFALAIFAYFGVRYLEENSGRLIEYNEDDGKLLLNMLQLSILKKEAPEPHVLEANAVEEIEPARPEAEKAPEFRLEDIEAANLDDETLLERKELHRKLEDLD